MRGLWDVLRGLWRIIKACRGAQGFVGNEKAIGSLSDII